MEFTWKVDSVDTASRTMVVEYSHADQSTRLNIPMPDEGEDIAAWVKVYAPLYDWQRLQKPIAAIEPGMTGVGTFEAPAPVETPNVVGSWNEEYLRALIYQILEEIRESEA